MLAAMDKRPHPVRKPHPLMVFGGGVRSEYFHHLV
jgi:hypothetical protein